MINVAFFEDDLAYFHLFIDLTASNLKIDFTLQEPLLSKAAARSVINYNRTYLNGEKGA